MIVREHTSSGNRTTPHFLFAILLTVCCLLGGRGVLAAPINAKHAQTAVSRWLARDGYPNGAKLGNRIRKTETSVDANGEPVYHVVYLTGDGTSAAGFVIVSGDDEAEPIVAFCSGDYFDPDTKNPFGALVSADLPTRVALARGSKTGVPRDAASSERKAKQKWDSLLETTTTAEGGTTSISDVRVAPLIASRWDQSYAAGTYCYNYYTPNHYLSGCVATALAQLLRFHKYPTTGVGVRYFSITVDGYSQTRTTMGGNGLGGAYSWTDMPLVPNSGATTTQRQAIGALLYDAGLAVNMSYTSSWSSAYTEVVGTALLTTFSYGNAKKGYNATWTDLGTALPPMVNPNLDAGFPVIFGINGSSNGHAIVCDGYGYISNTIYHHLNMGWSGSSDAWYALPLIQGSGYSFSIINKCIYNVFPSGTGEILSGRVTDNASRAISGATVTAKRTGGSTLTTTTGSNGIYAFAKIPSSSTYTVTVSAAGYNFTSRSATVGKSTDGGASGNAWGVDFTATAFATITTTASPPAGGWITGAGTYAYGTAVTLLALPNDGYNFANWTEGSMVVSSLSSYTFTASAGRSLVANFQVTPWGAWLTGCFSSKEIENPSISGLLCNPEGDGLCNLLKYAFLLDRKKPDRSLLPKTAVEDGFLALTYVANKSATDLTYTVEVSNDLLSWNSGTTYTSSPVLINSTGSTQTFKVTDRTALSAGRARFMRLRVDKP